jgi:hypothetical protein
MTRAIKITFGVAAVLGFAVGIVWGYFRAQEASKSMESAVVWSAGLVTSNFAWQQFEQADSASARQAVMLEIKILDRLERTAPDPAVETHLGLSYTRLGMIEEASGETEAERHDLDRAKGWFKQSHPRELTDEDLKKMLTASDRASAALSDI